MTKSYDLYNKEIYLGRKHKSARFDCVENVWISSFSSVHTTLFQSRQFRVLFSNPTCFKFCCSQSLPFANSALLDFDDVICEILHEREAHQSEFWDVFKFCWHHVNVV